VSVEEISGPVFAETGELLKSGLQLLNNVSIRASILTDLQSLKTG
jgi:hypothetical protein